MIREIRPIRSVENSDSLLAKLIDGIRNQCVDMALIDDVHCMLETMTLSNSEFDVAIRRLQNATSYCCAREFGAALYELRQMKNSLREAF